MKPRASWALFKIIQRIIEEVIETLVDIGLVMSRYSLNWVVATWAFTRLLLLHIVRDLHKLVMKKTVK